MTIVPFTARRPITSDTPRHAIEAEIERLIAILDFQDGDPDDEPILGWPDDDRANGAHVYDDREDDDDVEGGNFTEARAWRDAFEIEPRFLQFRRYRHDRDYLGVSAEGKE